MVTSEMSSAGYVFIYDTETGEQSKCNNNMLRQMLGLQRPNGRPVYTTRPPKEPPKRGTYKCLLHPDGPNRKHYDDLGLPTCRKANLTSPFQVNRHMQKRHPVEWATIESERVSREKQEERDFQRGLVAMASGTKTVGTPEAPLYVSDKDKKKTAK
jgi:hypothetical protein